MSLIWLYILVSAIDYTRKPRHDPRVHSGIALDLRKGLALKP